MWNKAYDIFQLIYIKTYPSKSTKDLLILTRELLTYRKHIIDNLKQGRDWLQYDKHFRSEMVNRGDSWSTIRFDLLITYNFNNKQKVSQRSQGHTTKQKMTNTCHDYNVRGKICVRFACPYSHSCAICLLKHPRYMCPTNAPTVDNLQLGVILTAHPPLCPRHICTRKQVTQTISNHLQHLN